MTQQSILLDGLPVPFEEGQTIMDAAMAAEIFIPHLCHHPEFKPQGSCKLCTVKATAATFRRARCRPRTAWRSRTTRRISTTSGGRCCRCCSSKAITSARRAKRAATACCRRWPTNSKCCRRISTSSTPIGRSMPRTRGAARLQSLHSLRTVRARQPRRRWQARLSLSGRGITKHLIVNAESGRLADTDFSLTDKAAHVCPVGVILEKRKGFAVPIGQRRYDVDPIGMQVERLAHRTTTEEEI
jgi:[NiFe] hydrogenase diaphorase moiety small subunit